MKSLKDLLDNEDPIFGSMSETWTMYLELQVLFGQIMLLQNTIKNTDLENKCKYKERVDILLLDFYNKFSDFIGNHFGQFQFMIDYNMVSGADMLSVMTTMYEVVGKRIEEGG